MIDPVAKTRYFANTQLVDLTGSEDSSKTWNESWKFEKVMLLWLTVEYGHIFCYFVERPGFFSAMQLVQWKVWKLITIFKVATVEL